jgi:hypothetical protein
MSATLRPPASLQARVPRLRHPAQFVVLGFLAADAVGTALLLLPVARLERYSELR